jgi:hypothetical protein
VGLTLMPDAEGLRKAHAPVAEGVDAVSYQPSSAPHRWSGPGLPLPHRPTRPGSRPQDGFLKVGKVRSVGAAPLPVGSATSVEQARHLSRDLRIVYPIGTLCVRSWCRHTAASAQRVVSTTAGPLHVIRQTVGLEPTSHDPTLHDACSGPGDCHGPRGHLTRSSSDPHGLQSVRP